MNVTGWKSETSTKSQTRRWGASPQRSFRRVLRLEHLETRDVPTAILSGNSILTPFDRIPNFGINPNVVAITSGSWLSPSTWSTGKVPTTGDVVSINSGQTVTYDANSTSAVKTVAIQAGGSLRFRTDIDTKLTVVNFLVMEGGELQIGSAATPVAPNVKASVIFADVPLDLAFDPEQYGNGMIAFGKVTTFGSSRSDEFVRLAAEPLAGSTSITLSSPVTGWQVGNRVVVPDTRQLPENQRWDQYTSQLEIVTISGISADGLALTLSAPLVYDHKGARDPDQKLTYMPHVGNLTHNVSFRSQSNFGTRGYVYFTHRAEVDIRGTSFGGLGRTTNAADDNTILDASNNPTHIGTNQAERYPVTFSHVLGAASGTASGYQYTFVDNSVTCIMNPQPFRWGLTITDSSYGLIENNVVYNWAGAGIVTSAGTEVSNVFSHNFVVSVKGDDNPRNNTGRDGSAFWLVGGNNYVRDNVATDAVCTYQGIVAGSGFNIFVPASSTLSTRIPMYPGADTTVTGQYRLINLQQTPILEFVRNEAYGALATGVTLWHFGTDGYRDVPIAQSVIKDFTAWHVWEDGVFAYPIHNVLFDGLKVLGDQSLASTGVGVGWTSGDYWASDVTIRNADIQNMSKGIGWSTNTPGNFRIESSFLRNYFTNIYVETLATPGARAVKPARSTIIDNVRFQPHPAAPTYSTISAGYNAAYASSNFIQRDEIYVLNYNGTTGDNFQLYYLAQAPSFIVPPTTYYGPDANNDGIGDWIDNLGAPVAGLTNAQAWAQYGIAIAGAISPTSQTRNNVLGNLRPFTQLIGIEVQNGQSAYLTEGGSTDSYGFALMSQPTSNVTIQLQPDAQLATSVSQLVFTPQNWNVRQYANVAAFNDTTVEGIHSGTLQFSVTSSDANYQGWPISDRVIAIHDNDTVFGINIQPSTALAVTEGGAAGSVSISLLSQPSANVTVKLTPNSQLTISPTQVVFTPQNWNLVQSVPVSAVNDTAVEGTHSGIIQFTVTSADPLYQGFAIADRVVPINDNDFLGGINLTPATPAQMSEAGPSDTVSFALLRQPTANVTIQIQSNPQLTFNATSVIFTPQNWNVPQIVTISVVDDATPEGNHPGAMKFTVTSADTAYHGLLIPDRIISIVDNDLLRVYATGSDAGSAPVVRMFDAATQTERFRIDAYASSFQGGVRVAVGDVNGDGFQDVITGAGSGGGPHIRVFSGKDASVITEFYSYIPQFTGGVWVASGDVNKDGYADILVGPGAGGGPHIRVFSGKDRSILTEFFAYTPLFTGGVRVAAGDVNGDGYSDIVTGAGPGGGPHVRAISGANYSIELASYFAYAPSFSNGIWVAAGDVDGDGKAEIITGASAGGGPHTIVWQPQTATILSQFFAYSASFAGGVRVAMADLNGDGKADIITAPGSGMAPTVLYRRGDTLAPLGTLNAYDPTFMGGVFVG